MKKIQKNIEVYYDKNTVKKIVCWNSACSNSEYILPEGYSAEYYYDGKQELIIEGLIPNRLYQVMGDIQEMKEIQRLSLNVQNSAGSMERVYQYQLEDLLSSENKDWTEEDWENFEDNLAEIAFQSLEN